jgi:DNA topoisomerase-1
MPSAELERTTVEIPATDGRAGFRATGSVTLFDGFLAVYQEGRDDDTEGEDGSLPRLATGDALKLAELRPEQHFTEPPPRYSEASLVKKLEELGIGRPSTYASILSTLRDRAYVRMDKNRFIPEDKGRIVTAFLASFFRRYVEYDFTADLEEKLDEVSAGELSWKQLLRDFWKNFHVAIEGTKELKFAEVISALDEILGPHMFPARADGGDPRICPTCGNGRLGLRLGKFGAFIGCSNYPDCKYTRQIGRGDENGSTEPRALGKDPATGLEVFVKTGRFGPYVQLGEGDEPKRSRIPRGFSPETLELEKALQLLSLPREIGLHPESGKPITAGFGRFGPFLAHDGAYASLETPEDVFTVGINRAVDLLAERKSKGRGRFRTAQALRELGPASEGGPPIKVMKGRYGPYVTDGKVNATLPKSADPMTVSLDEAKTLIEAKSAKGNGGPARRKAARTPKKANGGSEQRAVAKPARRAKKTQRKREEGPTGHG